MTATTSRRGRSQSSLDSLPFVVKRDFWHNVKSTGDYQQDCDLGSRYAYLALQMIKAEKFQPLLGLIVLDMIKNKCPDGIAVGFFQAVADVALGIHQIPAAHSAGAS